MRQPDHEYEERSFGDLLAALEQLSDSDLELITLYAYEEYDTVEISKLFGTTKQNISKKIRRITNFIKNFQMAYNGKGRKDALSMKF